MIKYIDKNIPRYKPPKNAKGGKGKGAPSKGTTVGKHSKGRKTLENHPENQKIHNGRKTFKYSNGRKTFKPDHSRPCAGEHDLNNATTTTTDGRVGGRAEEKIGLFEGDLCQIQHWRGSPCRQWRRKCGGGRDDQLADETERAKEAVVAELDLLEGAQYLHLPRLQGRLHFPPQEVPPHRPEQEL